MPKVGIRQLKNEASEIIRAVREQQAEYIVTYRGEPVAVIVPIEEVAKAEQQADDLAEVEAQARADYWARLDVLAAEIAAAWQSEKTAVELIDEQRRDL